MHLEHSHARSDMSLTVVIAEGQYTEEQYKTLKRKIDRYLLPLMWLCYGQSLSPTMVDYTNIVHS